MGFFDYRRGFRIESPVSIRRRRRGEPHPENDACDSPPRLVVGRGKLRETPRENPAVSLTPLQTIVVFLLLVAVVVLIALYGFLGTLVVIFYTAVPVTFFLIFFHLFRHRPGKGPPLRRRQD